MDKLISMTDFVIQQNMYYANKDISVEKLQLNILNYAMFLQQPLTLGMFIPCDLDGNVLEIIPFNEHKQGSSFEFMQHKLLDEAKERVLFEGWQLVYNYKCGAEVAKCKITGRCQFNIKDYINIEHLFNMYDFEFILTE